MNLGLYTVVSAGSWMEGHEETSDLTRQAVAGGREQCINAGHEPLVHHRFTGGRP